MRTIKNPFRESVLNAFFLIFITIILGVVVEAQSSSYYLTVKTGDRENAGTDATVFAKLKGTVDGETNWIKLDNPGNMDFRRNSETEYKLGWHQLRGNIQIRFLVRSNNRIDEGWYLEWFSIRENSRSDNRRRHHQVRNTWVLPDEMTPYYVTQLTGRVLRRPTTAQPNFDLTGLVLVPRSDGTFEFRRRSNVRADGDLANVILVPMSNGTYRTLDARVIYPANNRKTVSPGSRTAAREVSETECAKAVAVESRGRRHRKRDDCAKSSMPERRTVKISPISNSPNPRLIRPMTYPSAYKPIVYFHNKTNTEVEIYKLEDGIEKHHQTVSPEARGFEVTGAGQEWIVMRNGRSVGDYVANDRAYQLVTIYPQVTEAVRMEVQR